MKSVFLIIFIISNICITIYGSENIKCENTISYENKNIEKEFSSTLVDSICESLLQTEFIDSSVLYIDTIKNENQPYSAPDMIIEVDTLTKISILLYDFEKNNFIKLLMSLKFDKGEYLIYFDSNIIEKYLDKKKRFKILKIIGNSYTFEDGILIK